MGCNVSKDVKVEDQGNPENAANGWGNHMGGSTSTPMKGQHKRGIFDGQRPSRYELSSPVRKPMPYRSGHHGGDKTEMSEEKAAEKIQASFRGYKTRKVLKDNGVLPAKEENNKSNGGVDEKTEELPEHPEEKTTPKPSTALFADDDEIVDIDLTDADVMKAAAKIQASYRNFTAKKKQQPAPSSPPKTISETKETVANVTKEEEENLEDIDLEDPEVEKAALKIQSTFRGYKVRREVKTDEPMTNGEKGEDE